VQSVRPWFALPESKPLESVVVIGAGLAGCHLAYELAERGHHVKLLDAGPEIASGASGNQAGIIKPFVTREPNLVDEYYAAAFDYLLRLLFANPSLSDAASFNQCGVLQLLNKAYPNNNHYTACSQQEASSIAGVNIQSEAIFFAKAGWLKPANLCRALVKHPRIQIQLNCNVKRLEQRIAGWAIHCAGLTDEVIQSQKVVITNGHHISRFAQTTFLPIVSARGQTSHFKFKKQQALKTVVTGSRYLIPTTEELIVGASFDRDNENRKLSPTDHKENFLSIEKLTDSINVFEDAVNGFCAIRATTPDRLPLIGPVPNAPAYANDYANLKQGLPDSRFPTASYLQNLFVLGGFGSRGIVSAAFSAQLLAEFISGEIGTEQQALSQWMDLCHPGRFLIRDLKRGIPVTA